MAPVVLMADRPGFWKSRMILLCVGMKRRLRTRTLRGALAGHYFNKSFQILL